MDDITRLPVITKQIYPSIRATPPADAAATHSSAKDFKNILDIAEQAKKRQDNLKFSKHVETRMKSRNINMDSEQIQKIHDAVASAEKKGIKESLVVLDNVALVVSIKNKTVITAMDSKELKGNVFTNIDGAVII